MARIDALQLVIGFVAALPLAGCGGLPVGSVGSETNSARAASSSRAVGQSDLLALARFRGLSGAELTGLLGTPQLLRHDSTVELWQYRVESCVLHLFLYRDSAEWRVRYAEMRAPTVSDDTMTSAAEAECLAKLTAARPAPTS